jgi:hypothetical protein
MYQSLFLIHVIADAVGKRELTGLKSFVIEAAQNLTNAIHEEL